MKALSSLLATGLLLLTAPLLGFAQAGATPPAASTAPSPMAAPSPADVAWQEIETLRNRPTSKPGEFPPEEMVRRGDALRHEITAKLEAFYANFPDDPRRWRAVIGLRRFAPAFFVSAGPNPERPLDGATFDETARAAHAKRLAHYEAELLATPAAPAELKRTLEMSQLRRQISAASRKGRAGTRTEWDEVFAAIDSFSSRLEQSATGLQPATELISVALITFENINGEAALDYWTRYTDHPDDRLAKRARAKLGARALFAAPLELTFTAADGREVDLAKLRGKVVLIDFWATWCGPCIAELPNVKKVYADHHDQGFEVIGIALENPGNRPGDTPEQIAAKLAAAKQKLLDFVAKEAMPWPQHFDGKWWQNEVSSRYGISAIPAMFLLNQEGLVVTTDARGAKLETEVKRLLKL